MKLPIKSLESEVVFCLLLTTSFSLLISALPVVPPQRDPSNCTVGLLCRVVCAQTFVCVVMVFQSVRKHTQFLCNLDLTTSLKLHCWLFLLKLGMKLNTVLQNFSLPFKNQRGTFFRPHFQSSANNRTLMPAYETTCSMRYKLLFLHSTADKIPVSRAQAMNRNHMENKSTIHINSRSTDLLVIKNCRTVVNTDTSSSRSVISPRTQLVTQHCILSIASTVQVFFYSLVGTLQGCTIYIKIKSKS